MDITITQNDLSQLIRTIWESTLDLEVQPLPGLDLPDQPAGILMGEVQITGAWLGTVLLECSENLARKVACIMFGLNSEEPLAEEVRDALAEMTNIAAGNFKSLAGGHCHLSTPQVTERALAPPTAANNGLIWRQAFACQGEHFAVTLLEG